MLRTLAILLLVVTVPSLAHAGWIIQDSSGATVKIQSGKLRMDIREGAYIVDSESGTITVVAHPIKKWARSSVNRMCAAVRKIASVNEVSPESVRRYEETTLGKNGKGGFRSKGVKVNKTGRGPTVGGMPTQRMEVTNDGEPVFEILITNYRPMQLSLSDFNRRLIFQLEKCGLGWTALSSETTGQTDAVSQSRAYQRLLTSGWIVSKKDLVSGEVITKTTDIQSSRVDFSEFRPPSGYKEIPMKKMLRIVQDAED
ncbi:MAG: hypothetical protein AAF654_02030 [Myxococcota bacterium]